MFTYWTKQLLPTNLEIKSFNSSLPPVDSSCDRTNISLLSQNFKNSKEVKFANLWFGKESILKVDKFSMF